MTVCYCMTTSQIAVRLPDELLAAVDALVPGHHASRSEAVRRALELYLYRLACERDAEIYDDAPLTGAELALVEDETAWETAPPW